MAELSTTARAPLKVFALTGIRSEYDLFYPLLARLHREPDFEVGVIVAGAHLTPLHDFSVRQIERDGFPIVARIRNLELSDHPTGKIHSMAKLLAGLADLLARERPDLLVVLGDREDPLAGAIAGSHSGVPVVHLCGGDNTCPVGGNIDEEVRHATTKLSHLHLTMAPEHRERVLRLGEEEWRVHVVGNPGLDRLKTDPYASVDELARSLGEGVRKPYAVLIHHPLSSSLEAGAAEIELCLKSAIAAGLEVFVGMPNSDPGFERIVETIDRYRSHPQVHVYRNLPRYEFAGLLRGARVLIGNSSLGLHEAPFIGLPAVNVGERQRGRLAGKNVVFVDAEPAAVQAAVERAARDQAYRTEVQAGGCPYGDGTMVEKTLAILRSLPAREKLLAKHITY